MGPPNNTKKDDRMKSRKNAEENEKPRKQREKHETVTKDSDHNVCPICGLVFSSDRYLNNHTEKRHMTDVRTKCNYCSVRFSSKWDQDDHYRRKHKTNNRRHNNYDDQPYFP